MRPAASLGAAAFILAACGARTELGGSHPLGDASVDSAMDAFADAPGDAPSDAIVITDAGCKADAECDDGIACTIDACDGTLHVCTHAPRDALCDDGLFCDGDETCNPQVGCVTTPRNCADAVSCTVDTCDETNDECVHEPDDALCPISHICDPLLGCQAHALAHDSSTLYDVRIPSGQVNTIGPTGSQLTDVALSPSNVLYGIGFGALYTVSQSTGQASLLKSINSGGINGADIAPSGTLYVAGGSALSTLDIPTGALSFVASFPGGTSSSGDLAFIGNRLLATATGSGGDDLVEFDLVAKTSKILGSVGFTCVWGLAAYGQTLYGLTCEGRILSIDTTTGAGSQLNQISTSFWGASAR